MFFEVFQRVEPVEPLLEVCLQVEPVAPLLFGAVVTPPHVRQRVHQVPDSQDPHSHLMLPQEESLQLLASQ